MKYVQLKKWKIKFYLQLGMGKRISRDKISSNQEWIKRIFLKKILKHIIADATQVNQTYYRLFII